MSAWIGRRWTRATFATAWLAVLAATAVGGCVYDWSRSSAGGGGAHPDGGDLDAGASSSTGADLGCPSGFVCFPRLDAAWIAPVIIAVDASPPCPSDYPDAAVRGGLPPFDIDGSCAPCRCTVDPCGLANVLATDAGCSGPFHSKWFDAAADPSGTCQCVDFEGGPYAAIEIPRIDASDTDCNPFGGGSTSADAFSGSIEVCASQQHLSSCGMDSGMDSVCAPVPSETFGYLVCAVASGEVECPDGLVKHPSIWSDIVDHQCTSCTCSGSAAFCSYDASAYTALGCGGGQYHVDLAGCTAVGSPGAASICVTLASPCQPSGGVRNGPLTTSASWTVCCHGA